MNRAHLKTCGIIYNRYSIVCLPFTAIIINHCLKCTLLLFIYECQVVENRLVGWFCHLLRFIFVHFISIRKSKHSTHTHAVTSDSNFEINKKSSSSSFVLELKCAFPKSTIECNIIVLCYIASNNQD